MFYIWIFGELKIFYIWKLKKLDFFRISMQIFSRRNMWCHQVVILLYISLFYQSFVRLFIFAGKFLDRWTGTVRSMEINFRPELDGLPAKNLSGHEKLWKLGSSQHMFEVNFRSWYTGCDYKNCAKSVR